MSEAEETLLFQIRAVGLPEPIRELRFAPPRKWRFDLAWLKQGMVALEVDGGIWIVSRHTNPRGYENDCEKLNEALCLGWRVLRVTPGQVNSGEALGWIERALKTKGQW
jgi:very-short-patch-repair endonuclease